MPRARTWPLVAALLALTFAAYLPLWNNEFINLDDGLYITDNPEVLGGLTAHNVGWAWTNVRSGYWQPLAWHSLQLDAHLFAARSSAGRTAPPPAAVHGQNLLWHLASAWLLFALWHRLTGSRGQAFLVAALFAVHPMHVESVAWAAERKDVLSVFFGLLTTRAYVHYTESPGWKRYLGVAAAFALSLLCKPMLMTLPFVLLLLDYWPLCRVRPGGTSFRRVAVDKVPLLALAAGIAVVTVVARQRVGSAVSLQALPFSARLGTAGTAYGWYLLRTAWPADLAVFYPHPYLGWSLTAFSAGVGALLAVSLGVLWQARRRPWLAVGWFWFVGALLPVIGLAQGGGQAWADRFSYWPHVGLFAAAAGGLAEVVRRLCVPTRVAALLTALVLGTLGALTWAQVGYWRDSATLWERALAVTDENATAHSCLAQDLESRGLLDEAERHYAEAVRISPACPEMRYGMGVTLLGLGKEEEAVAHLREAVRLVPTDADAWHNLGVARLRQGNADQAVRSFRKALDLQAASSDTQACLGLALWRAGQREEALHALRTALDGNPHSADAWNGLGVAYLTQGRPEEAAEAFGHALQSNPGMASAVSNLGVAHGRQGRWADAVTCHLRAVELQKQGERALTAVGGRVPAPESVPQLVIYQCRLAYALDQCGNRAAATAIYREALRRDPSWPSVLAARARALATDPDENQRDPQLARELAGQATRAAADPYALAAAADSH
jgi:Flp pilus assembly protein TadD